VQGEDSAAARYRLFKGFFCGSACRGILYEATSDELAPSLPGGLVEDTVEVMVEVEEWPDTFGDREGNVLMREGQEHTIDQVFSEDDSAPAYAKASAGS
jgi:hypothetical protein